MKVQRQYTKCDFCRYWNGSTCLARPDSNYCNEAKSEFYAWLRNKNQPAGKSLRKWDRR